MSFAATNLSALVLFLLYKTYICHADIDMLYTDVLISFLCTIVEVTELVRRFLARYRI